MIRTVIAEDSPLAQRYLRSILAADGRFDVVATFDDAFAAERRCMDGTVDLVLMDVQTAHNHSGLAAGERIRAGAKHTKIVAVTSLIDPEILARAKAGAADSLWYKDHGSEDLMAVIERTIAGERVFPDAAPSVELKEMLSGDISPRQLAILRRFVRGMTYDEIAEDLKLTERGVRWNMKELVEKGGFANRHELLTAILQNRLIITSLMETETEQD